MMTPTHDASSCVHRWRVETPRPGPAGRMMPAHCGRCGASREYDRAPEPLRLRGGRARPFNPSIAPRRAA